MKNFALIFVHVACAFILFMAACSDTGKSNLKGDWHTQDGSTRLRITDKQFVLLSESDVPEDYFLKGDTIFTSFEGSQPYTRFVIQKLDDHSLKLLYPDSVSIDFVR
ncbi:hypothetical protein [Mucilaginibacter lacusdianchii]|uniref:hypothetical protein n=1 Tax=Mucilaginibacter lacusdianchii TaxID=2684211 RepID=UPI00131B2FF7|nr:hypothetical protein [Mucilaginibacter sp. JXJ CY 39]